MPKDIFAFIKQQEAAYELPIVIVDGWEWSMKEHIRLSTLYKNSQFSVGNTKVQRDDKPFKNIVRPILNLQYRTEGFDLKDVVLYIDDTQEYFKSFLVNKFHGKWANDNEIDTFIDEMVESYVDYGGALIKDVNEEKPEVQPLYSIAFADQSNLLAAPFAFKHFYSPDELQAFSKKGWGDPKNNADITIQDLIVIADEYKVPDAQTGEQVKVSTKAIEVYEIHGVLPESYLYKATGDADVFINQLQIVGFYKDKDGKKQGVTLFAGEQKKDIFKLLLRDKIHGRALGFGGVEELFEAQVWTNYGEIIKKGMLDLASKIFFKTTDGAFKDRNKVIDGDNGQVFTVDDGKDINQLNTQPVNLPAFERAVADWQDHAQQIGGATDALMGINPPAGMPFALQELTTQQAQALHVFRRGKIATFYEQIEREWILPWLVKDMGNGKKFLSELSMQELQQVADSLVECQANDIIKDKILKGQEIIPSDIDAVKAKIRANFMKGGSKKFLEIFKGEMKDVPLSVKVDVAGKQKDLAGVTDKLVNIFKQIIAMPQILDDPRMANILNQILEASGLSPVDFGMALPPKPQAVAPVQTPVPSPVIPTQTVPAA